ncbi:MAG: CPBP family intramembrane metalloprotease [Bacteroidales bacterium]|jgi:membrane protease YdiL (CAAX protease family)|nr:CPBP family intramembrane metalloprotease [Bacteroidales bacterium]
MNLRDAFIHQHPAVKILVVFMLAFIGLLVSQVLTAVVLAFFPNEILGNSIDSATINISVIKIIQIISSVGIFLLPAYIIAFISTPDPTWFLKINLRPKWRNIFLTTLLVFSSIAIINLMATWNANLKLPDSMANLEGIIQRMEKTAMQMQQRMLNVDGIGGVLVNIVVIAVFPAVTEELFFRGILQRLLRNWVKNAHVAILVTGILFSFAHFQFYGFVPRMFLGIVLGYLLFLTNNLWIPIFAHFLNNSLAVLGYYFYYKTDKDFNPDELGTSWDSPYLYVSILLFAFVSFYFFRQKRKTRL